MKNIKKSFMRKNGKSLLCIPVLLLFLSLIAIPTYASDTQTIKASPEAQEVDVGQEFTVDIIAENWEAPGLWGYELKLYYDTTILDVIAAEIPTGHFLEPTAGGIFFPVDSGTTNETEGCVSFAGTLLSPEPGKTGNGTLVTITFNGTAMGFSLLTVGDVILVDPDANEIPSATYVIIDDDVTVIPEFPAVLIIPLLLAATLISAILGKTYRSKKPLGSAVVR